MGDELDFGSGEALAGFEQKSKTVVRAGQDAVEQSAIIERHAEVGALVVEAADSAFAAVKEHRAPLHFDGEDASFGDSGQGDGVHPAQVLDAGEGADEADLRAAAPMTLHHFHHSNLGASFANRLFNA